MEKRIERKFVNCSKQFESSIKMDKANEYDKCDEKFISVIEMGKRFDKFESKFDKFLRQFESLTKNFIHQQRRQSFNSQVEHGTSTQSNVVSIDHDYYNANYNSLNEISSSIKTFDSANQSVSLNQIKSTISDDSIITISDDDDDLMGQYSLIDEIPFSIINNDNSVHSIESHSDVQNSSSSSLSNENSITTQIMDEDKKFPCPKCSYRFNTQHNLDIHMKTHKAANKYICTICGARFTRKFSLDRHLNIHTGDLFKCDICDSFFTQKDYLVLHRRTHNGDFPFKCNQCHYVTIHKSSFIIHRRIHDGVEPSFKCNRCEYATHHKNALVYHRRSHTGERPYKCQKCELAYTNSSALLRHRRANHPDDIINSFQCQYCDSKFTRSFLLIRHLRKHTN